MLSYVLHTFSRLPVLIEKVSLVSKVKGSFWKILEAIKMAVRGNMHMDTRVIEVPNFNSEVKFEI